MTTQCFHRPISSLGTVRCPLPGNGTEKGMFFEKLTNISINCVEVIIGELKAHVIRLPSPK